MLAELCVASAMVLMTVSLHAMGLTELQRLFNALIGGRRGVGWRVGAPALVLVVLGLFALHGVEIWAYAVLYHLLGAVPDLHTAIYFSTITYGAIGYSDAAIAGAWRLTAAIEGINGVLLIGWTTAFVVPIMGRLQGRGQC